MLYLRGVPMLYLLEVLLPLSIIILAKFQRQHQAKDYKRAEFWLQFVCDHLTGIHFPAFAWHVWQLHAS